MSNNDRAIDACLDAANQAKRLNAELWRARKSWSDGQHKFFSTAIAGINAQHNAAGKILVAEALALRSLTLVEQSTPRLKKAK